MPCGSTDAREVGCGCVAGCLETWKPVLAPENGQGSGFWEVAIRPDGAKQWAYKGAPLYTYAGDKQPGDDRGDNRHDVVFGDPEGKIDLSLTGGDRRSASGSAFIGASSRSSIDRRGPQAFARLARRLGLVRNVSRAAMRRTVGFTVFGRTPAKLEILIFRIAAGPATGQRGEVRQCVPGQGLLLAAHFSWLGRWRAASNRPAALGPVLGLRLGAIKGIDISGGVYGHEVSSLVMRWECVVGASHLTAVYTKWKRVAKAYSADRVRLAAPVPQLIPS